MLKKVVMMILCTLVAGGLALSPSSSAIAKKEAAGQLKKAQFSIAYTDQSGKHVLGENSKSPKHFSKALAAPGKIVSVTYVKHQKSTDKNNGRQTASNFTEDEGELFRLSQGKVCP
jgi:hypothetical protein